MTQDEEGFSRLEVPYLEDWLTFPEVGHRLGISKQMVHKLVFVNEVFNIKNDVRKLGQKPIYVVREEAVTSYQEGKKNVQH